MRRGPTSKKEVFSARARRQILHHNMDDDRTALDAVDLRVRIASRRERVALLRRYAALVDARLPSEPLDDEAAHAAALATRQEALRVRQTRAEERLAELSRRASFHETWRRTRTESLVGEIRCDFCDLPRAVSEFFEVDHCFSCYCWGLLIAFLLLIFLLSLCLLWFVFVLASRRLSVSCRARCLITHPLNCVRAQRATCQSS